jgi:adenylosuccinate lyase
VKEMAIKRYTRPEMEMIWSDERKFQNWLDIEIAILEAKEKLGLIPVGMASLTKQKARFTVAEIEKKEKKKPGTI